MQIYLITFVVYIFLMTMPNKLLTTTLESSLYIHHGPTNFKLISGGFNNKMFYNAI